MLKYVSCSVGMAIAMIVIGIAVSEIPLHQLSSTAENIATVLTVAWIIWQVASGIHVSRDKFPKSLWYIPAIWIGGLIGFGLSTQVISIIQVTEPQTRNEFLRNLFLAPFAFSIPGASGYLSGLVWRHIIVKIWRLSVPTLEA